MRSIGSSQGGDFGLEGAQPLGLSFGNAASNNCRPRRADTDNERLRCLRARLVLPDWAGNGHDGSSLKRGTVGWAGDPGD